MTPSPFSPNRARMMGRKHMAAAGHYLAAQAAFQILEAGGNAVDAGAAGGIALGVLQSEYVGFGGVAPIMIRMAGTGEVVTISGLGHWPAATDVEIFRAKGEIPRGVLRTVIPAAPDAWITALARFGTMSYADVAGAALRFAREGFPIAALSAEIIAKAKDGYAEWDSSAGIYLPGGKPPAPGDLFIQSDLADSIAYMVDEERAASGDRIAGLAAARDAFYKGDIAKRMAEYHAENGGWLTVEDLATFHVDVEAPVSVAFGGTTFHTCRPWCQGPLLAQTFGLLDGADLKSLGHNSVGYIHHLVEALKLAFADRHAHFGDPKFVDVPLDRLLSADYLADRRDLIDAEKACPGMPEAGCVAGVSQIVAKPEQSDDFVGSLDTSYICVVDSDGNAFSATPSDGSSASPVIPGLGFAPSSRGSQSWIEEGHPAVVAPGRRPRLTPSPAMAERPGEWLMPFGSPGNDVQAQAMLQTYLNIHLWGMTPQEAVEAPRFATFSYPRSSEPHAYDPGLLRLEGRIDDSVAAGLSELGHDVQRWKDWDYQAGGVCAILADLQNEMLEGGSDPRRPTGIAGW